MRILVTGGAGFIGSNFIRYIVANHIDWQVVNLDKLTYAGNLDNLSDIEKCDRYQFVKGDIVDSNLVDELLSSGFDAVINFAAESHVDRSIVDSSAFIETNVKGTQVLLEGIRKQYVGRYVQVSTDEVYGALFSGKFNENSPINPNNPYAASKAAGDLLCQTYQRTYDLPIVITRCSNNFGPFQFPEKLIPLSVTNILEGKKVPVFGDGLNIRDWIYVEDHCRAIDLVILKGQPGEVYNVGASNEKTNLELLEVILNITGTPRDILAFVSDRPGHDRRYAIDAVKITTELGWKPVHKFDEALELTINWYIDNYLWWNRIKKREYLRPSGRV